jgi:hypothetical protein
MPARLTTYIHLFVLCPYSSFVESYVISPSFTDTLFLYLPTTYE